MFSDWSCCKNKDGQGIVKTYYNGHTLLVLNSKFEVLLECNKYRVHHK